MLDSFWYDCERLSLIRRLLQRLCGMLMESELYCPLFPPPNAIFSGDRWTTLLKCSLAGGHLVNYHNHHLAYGLFNVYANLK